MMKKRNQITKNKTTLQKGWKTIVNRLSGTFHIRQNFKDRLFITLFHDKKELLILYNGNYSEPNLAKPTVLLDVAYPPNNFMQRYVYECKHSPHILDKVAWL